MRFLVLSALIETACWTMCVPQRMRYRERQKRILTELWRLLGVALLHDSLQVSVGDIVLKLGRAGGGVLAAGQVEACISEAGSLYVMMLEMAFVRRQGSHGAVFSGYSRRLVWPVEWVSVPVCWLEAVDGWLVVMA